jgi:hypothetical protein
VRAECNYKIRIESEVDRESSEMVQRHISSVAFYDSMKNYRAPLRVGAMEEHTSLTSLAFSGIVWSSTTIL